jgi:hypothetical protein
MTIKEGLAVAILLLGVRTFPQPHAAKMTLDDVHVGAARSVILQGLAANYQLQEIDEDGTTWTVSDKGPPDPSSLRGIVTFQEGRVSNVQVFLASGDSPETLAFTQELFRATYPFTQPRSGEKPSWGSRRTVNAVVEVEESHVAQFGDTQVVRLRFGETAVELVMHSGGGKRYTTNVQLLRVRGE